MEATTTESLRNKKSNSTTRRSNNKNNQHQYLIVINDMRSQMDGIQKEMIRLAYEVQELKHENRILKEKLQLGVAAGSSSETQLDGNSRVEVDETPTQQQIQQRQLNADDFRFTLEKKLNNIQRKVNYMCTRNKHIKCSPRRRSNRRPGGKKFNKGFGGGFTGIVTGSANKTTGDV